MSRPETTNYVNPSDHSDHIRLRDHAAVAHVIWTNRWINKRAAAGRCKSLPPHDTAKVAAYDDIMAQLVAFALADVEATPLGRVGTSDDQQAEFDAAKRIRDEHDRLDPIVAAVLRWDDSEICSHGVSLDKDCGACAV